MLSLLNQDPNDKDNQGAKVRELQVILPRVDPESLEVVLNMTGGNVEKAAQFIVDLLQQQGDMSGDALTSSSQMLNSSSSMKSYP